ncbi:MAG: hypothetical protein SFT90_00530 [Rickettsiales bacterium]|nr:hypothetical protein [Rickettsiales bacterium]
MTSIKTKRLLDKAKEYFRDKNYSKCIEFSDNILQIDPDNIPAILLLARGLKNIRNFELAVKAYNLAINKNDKLLDAYLELSEIYFNTKQYDKAGNLLEVANNIFTNNFDILNRLALTYKIFRLNEQASNLFIKAFEIQPNNIPLLKEMCSLVYITKSVDEAKKYYQKLYDLEKSDGTLVTMKTLCPWFFNSSEDIKNWRSEYEENLNNLLNKNLHIKNPLIENYQTFYHLIYQNYNNRELNKKYAMLLRKATPILSFEASHIKNYKKPNDRKIRIGFIIRYDATHVVADCFASIFKNLLDNKHYEALIFSTAQIENNDNIWLEYKNLDRAFNLPIDILESQKFIESKQPDIIIHLELGINSLSYYLAYARLAPVQCSMNGIPITSGIDTIDYYISSKNFDDEESQEYFTEKMILLDNYCDFPDVSEFKGSFKNKVELNLPSDKKLYIVPLKLHKFHPDFDKVIEAILKKDENGAVVLFEDREYITNSIKNRLKSSLSRDIFERILFLPKANKNDFISYLKEADCLLDSFYFGAGSTGYMAFIEGYPIVTMKKGFLCGGRLAAAFYSKIGLNSLIAKDINEYVEICFNLANDRGFYNSAQKTILENKDVLFNREKSFQELLEKFSMMLEKY